MESLLTNTIKEYLVQWDPAINKTADTITIKHADVTFAFGIKMIRADAFTIIDVDVSGNNENMYFLGDDVPYKLSDINSIVTAVIQRCLPLGMQAMAKCTKTNTYCKLSSYTIYFD